MILAQLRESTQSAHQNVEGTVDVMRPDLSVEHYQRLLLAFYTFYKPLESQLRTSSAWDESRSKISWLESDLLSLGFKKEELSGFSSCDDLPTCDTPAQALGVMYVLEGSTLGGHVITEHLQTRHPHLPTQFFASYGAEIGLRWREFIQKLEVWSGAHADQSHAVMQAASETFSKLSHWLLKWKQSYQH